MGSEMCIRDRLWEFDGDMPEGYRLTCTVLDPEFESTESSGEVLLNVPLDAQS